MKISREKRKEDIIKSFFEGKRLKTSFLADKYNVNIRSIQKDINEIKEILPLKKEKGEYFLEDEYILKDTQEMHPLAMDMAINVIDKTLPKYRNIIQDSLDVKLNDIFLFDFELEEIKNESLFLNLKKAILDEVAIKFEYKGYEKNIYPLKIANFNSYWYLIGYDLIDQIIKTFYLDNIDKIYFHNESFIDINSKNKLKNLKITSSWYNENPQKTNLILFNEAKKYISRRIPQNIKIIEKTEEFLKIEFNYFNEIEVLNFVKKWLGNIKIEDKELKQKVKTLLLDSLNSL